MMNKYKNFKDKALQMGKCISTIKSSTEKLSSV